VVLLDGMWFAVVPGTFNLQQAREWSGRESAFGWGFTFCSGDYRLYGPVSSLTAIVVPR
jgi:hypothetical protein